MKEDIKLFNVIADALLKDEIEKPVTDYIPVNELDQTVDISLSQNPIGEEEFSKILKDLVLKTPKTSSRMFFNQLFGGRKSKAKIAAYSNSGGRFPKDKNQFKRLGEKRDREKLGNCG